MSQLECINYFWNAFFRTLKKSGKLFMIALIFEWELVALTAINDVDLTHKKQNFLVWKVFCDVKFLDQQFLGKIFLIKTKEMVWIKGFLSLRQISCKMGLNLKVAFWPANGSFSFMQSFSLSPLFNEIIINQIVVIVCFNLFSNSFWLWP